MAMRRNAFTLIEVVVGVTIAAILAVGFYVTVGSSGSLSAADDRARRASQAAFTLWDIATAIAALETTNPPVSYLQTVGAYPTALSQLTVPITTADRNSCDRAGDAYLAGAVPADPVNPGYVQGWKGPYFSLSFPPGGTTQITEGFIAQDDLIRIPSNPVNNPKGSEWAGRLLIRMNNVAQLDAQALDAEIDRTVDNALGTVRYTASDPTSVDYELRVSRC